MRTCCCSTPCERWQRTFGPSLWISVALRPSSAWHLIAAVSGEAHSVVRKRRAAVVSLETCGRKGAHRHQQEISLRICQWLWRSPTERTSRSSTSRAHFMEIYRWQDLHAAGRSQHLPGSSLWNMASGVRGAHLLAVFLTFSSTLFRDADGQGSFNDLTGFSLSPPYFNLAAGSTITATATCGQDEFGTPRSDLYCKLVGGPTNGLVSHNIQVTKKAGWSLCECFLVRAWKVNNKDTEALEQGITLQSDSYSELSFLFNL